MASSRAEAMARYAQATRFHDVTRLPPDDPFASTCDGPSFLQDSAFAARICTARLVRTGANPVRAAVLLYALTVKFPAVPALLFHL